MVPPEKGVSNLSFISLLSFLYFILLLETGFSICFLVVKLQLHMIFIVWPTSLHCCDHLGCQSCIAGLLAFVLYSHLLLPGGQLLYRAFLFLVFFFCIAFLVPSHLISQVVPKVFPSYRCNRVFAILGHGKCFSECREQNPVFKNEEDAIRILKLTARKLVLCISSSFKGKKSTLLSSVLLSFAFFPFFIVLISMVICHAEVGWEWR